MAKNDYMILSDLIKGVETKRVLGSRDLEISAICYDSKEVRGSSLFTAIRGEKTDGHKYIELAVKNGAKALLIEEIPVNSFTGVTIIQVEDTKSTLAEISANFFDHPTKEFTLVGVTGTNGKTTITYLFESIMQEWGKNAGVVGTVDYRFSGKKISSVRTTPESLDLMSLFRDMRNSAVQCVVMEVSSHAVDRKRVFGCHFDAAVFTNLSQDHLDYHGTMENYFEAKKKLFSEVLRKSEKREKFSVINIDDQYGREIAREAVGKIVPYSILNSEGVYTEERDIASEGIHAVLNTPWGKAEIDSKLFGKHNLYNILAAASAALSLGARVDVVERGISKVTRVPGRLDRVENPFGITILVDYAHTPDALRNVLMAVRPFTHRKLILLFGCGGDRDPIKRPIMGRVGRELSDVLIVTSDNPRTEDPELIINQIEKGVFGAGSKEKPYFRTTDRGNAIRKAIEIAQKGDTVLLAGKGHENYQISGTEKIPFDDKEVAERIIREKANA